VAPHRFRVYARLVEFEHRGVVDDFVRLAVDDLVEMDRLHEAAADVKELQAERQSQVPPQGVIGAKTQRLILIVAELGHRRRQSFLRRLIRIAGELAGLALEPCIVEGLARRSRRGRCAHRELGVSPLSGRQCHGRFEYCASSKLHARSF
jgi:hypothetical protein